MQTLFPILFSLYAFAGFSVAQTPAIVMDEGRFVSVFEKFYSDLAKGSAATVAPRVIHYRAVSLENAFLYGAALERGPEEPLSITPQSQLADQKLIAEPFKLMTGQDLVSCRLLIVSYPYPKHARDTLAARGAKPFSRFYRFEDVHCDLWMLGTDGEWRVACDYHPGYGPHNQTLGLQFTDDKDFAEKQRLGQAASRKQWEKSLVGE
jgi:hypothetical protein